MKKVLDLHIHSKHSRACSPKLSLPNIEETCRQKGVDIIATGDFTYPAWFKDIKSQLTEKEEGLYQLAERPDSPVRFILSTELALIYKDKGKARRIHIMVQAPNVAAVEKLNKFLDKHYNIRSDGRPILGMSAPDLVKLCLDIDDKFLIYPAHIWTPWFSVFGSKSGFDSMEECFDGQVKHIYAYETGLSSDPEMNWRVSALDSLTLLSNSDAHSPANIAREANVFDLDELSYAEIYKIIKNKDEKKIKYTIEFYPEEGMYHYDGHRACGVSLSPKETLKHKGICPKCKKKLTVGVDYRVEELADHEPGRRPDSAADYVKLIELDKAIAQALGIKSRNSKKVQAEYRSLTDKLGPELEILLNTPIKKIEEASSWPRVAEAVRRIRAGELTIHPGYDGQYGRIDIFTDDEKSQLGQSRLFK